jgi:hypothetical protein
MTNQAQAIAQARKVVEATTTHLCHQALHITAHYKQTDVFVCIQKMTDEEWQLWARQPAFVKAIYLRLAEKGDGWRDIVQLAFDAAQRIQAKMVLEAR